MTFTDDETFATAFADDIAFGEANAVGSTDAFSDAHAHAWSLDVTEGDEVLTGEYATIDDVFMRERYMAGVAGDANADFADADITAS